MSVCGPPSRPCSVLHTSGSLRANLIYPDVANEQARSDETLTRLLQLVGLEYLLRADPKAPGSLDAESDWSDMLSLGEQQRISFARLLYHSPKFAIMDESTSALDVELEARCMRLCLENRITCISVGHRPTLRRFHARILSIDATGTAQVVSSPDWAGEAAALA